MFKIEHIGNIYVTPTFSEAELNFYNCFLKSAHFYNPSDDNLGLYELSCNNHFVFDSSINASRINSFDPTDSDNIFPFFNSFISFTEKSLKFEDHILSLKNNDEFQSYLQLLAYSLIFHYRHFFNHQAYIHTIVPGKYSFLKPHEINGTLYFKLSSYADFYKVVIQNSSFSFFKGSYHTSINGKNFIISQKNDYDFISKKKLLSFYDKLSLIDIKNNAIFEDGTIINYEDHEFVKKLLSFKKLDNKLVFKNTEKVKKI